MLKNAFKSADKSLAAKLMVELTIMRYDGSRTMNDHVIKMTNLTTKSRNLGMNLDDSFVVQFVLNSLPTQYGPFQINNNTIKDKWDINEMQSKLVEEECRLNKQNGYVAHLVTKGVGKKKFGKGIKGKPAKSGSSQPVIKNDKRTGKYHFCKKVGHFQNDCLKRKVWFEKKGKPTTFVCFEFNLVDVLSNTCWIDSGASTHISNTMQGFFTTRNTNSNEAFLYIGNRAKAPR